MIMFGLGLYMQSTKLLNVIYIVCVYDMTNGLSGLYCQLHLKLRCAYAFIHMRKSCITLAQLVVFLDKDLVSLQPNPYVTSSKGSLSPYGVETPLSGLAVYPSDHRWWMGSFDCLYVLFCCIVLFYFVYLS